MYQASGTTTSSIAYDSTTQAAYVPDEGDTTDTIVVVIDGVTQVRGAGEDYTIVGSEIRFTTAKSAPATNTLDTITFTAEDTYDLTKTATDTLDTITFTASATELDTITFTASATELDTITLGGSSVTLDTITFDMSPSAGPYNLTTTPAVSLDPITFAPATSTYNLLKDGVAVTSLDQASFAITDGGGDALTEGMDYMLMPCMPGCRIYFYDMNRSGTTSSIAYDGTPEPYVVADTSNLNIVIDGTPQVLGAEGDYTYDSDNKQITFTAGNEKTASNTVNTIEYGATGDAGPYNLTTTPSVSLDPITFSPAMFTYNLFDDGVAVTSLDEASFVIKDSNGDAYTEGSDYSLQTNMDGNYQVNFNTYQSGTTSSIAYDSTPVLYEPADASKLNIVIDNTTLVLDTHYEIDGSEITFTAGNEKTASNIVNSIKYEEVTEIEPAEAADLEIVLNDRTLSPGTHYTIDGNEITFKAAAAIDPDTDTMESLTHNTGATLTSLDTTKVTPFVRTETTGKFTVEVNNELQVEGAEADYTIDGSEITFTAAKTNSDEITALLHSEEDKYTFDITATDPINLEERQREFIMYVSKPGIALITPKREVGLVKVDYNNFDYPVVVPLAAATYNQGENVTLSLTAATAGNLAGSGLTFESITGVGTVEGGLEGSPASLAEDTDFTITVKAVETGEPSYNNERTLTIKILQDPDYYSPAS